MSDRSEFEKWFRANVDDCDDIGSDALFECWQAARAQTGQGAELVAWGPKPSRPGRYVVRGFDSAGTEALVCVAEDDGELVCNLHDSNSNPLESYSNLMSEISDRFEWVELHTHPQPAQQGSVPEGWRECLTEMVQAMHDYEMSVDEDAPYKHRAMMDRAHALLSTPITPPPQQGRIG